MFEIGLKDTITIKKPVMAAGTDGNRNVTYTTIIEDQACRKVTTEHILTDENGARIVVKDDKVIVNYTGTAIDETCIAILNSENYEIQRVDPAEGFGRKFISITLKARKA